MTYKVMNSTQKQSFDTMGTAGFVPYYRLEPDVVSGATISGDVMYRGTADNGLKTYAYSFSADGLNDGEYCIIASIVEISDVVVILQPQNIITSNHLKLAYVTISNGRFTDFRLVGDGYLKTYADSKVADKIPYYQLEPTVTTGTSISGWVYYKSNNAVKGKEYSFSADGKSNGEYCIIASPNEISENVVMIVPKSLSQSNIILAYVTVTDGRFTDFRLCGDGYLKTYANSTASKAKLYAKDYTDSKLDEHNSDENAHMDIRNDITGEVTLAVGDHNDDETAHSTLFNPINAHIDDLDNRVSEVSSNLTSHNTSNKAHADIRNDIDTLYSLSGDTSSKAALLQKYPCYEYAASGGAVQRFDDVSVIPHTIGATVHGATDDSGSSVTNPTVRVYGKNLFKTIHKSDGKGYESIGSMIKITNPITGAFVNNTTKYHDSFILGKGTYTLSVEAVGQAELASGAFFQILYKLADVLIGLWIPKLNQKYSKVLTVESPTVFSFNQVNMGAKPTSADLSLQIQLEAGDTATDFVEAVEPQTASFSGTLANGEVWKPQLLNAVSPTMTVIASDDNGLISTVDVTYNRDVKKALDKLEAAIAALV